MSTKHIMPDLGDRSRLRLFLSFKNALFWLRLHQMISTIAMLSFHHLIWLAQNTTIFKQKRKS
jgi:hypothetical protein